MCSHLQCMSVPVVLCSGSIRYCYFKQSLPSDKPKWHLISASICISVITSKSVLYFRRPFYLVLTQPQLVCLELQLSREIIEIKRGRPGASSPMQDVKQEAARGGAQNPDGGSVCCDSVRTAGTWRKQWCGGLRLPAPCSRGWGSSLLMGPW